MRIKTMTLREAREEKAWTIEELSKRSGVAWGTVQAIEKGRMPGNLHARHKLAEALRIPLQSIWPETYQEIQDLGSSHTYTEKLFRLRTIYRKLVKLMTLEEKLWLTERLSGDGDVIDYQGRLLKLAKKYGITSEDEQPQENAK